MLIIPTGTTRSQRRRTPFVTFVLAAVTVLAFVGSDDKIERQGMQEMALLEAVFSQWWSSGGIPTLPDEALALFDQEQREAYHSHQEWVQWFEDSPAAVALWLSGQSDTHAKDRVFERLVSNAHPLGDPVDLLEAMGADQRKFYVLSMLAHRGASEREALQTGVDQAVEELLVHRKRSILHRYAYVPAHPTFKGLFGHMFLHGGWIHLVFNLLFLFVVMMNLEDCWSGPVVLVAYLLFGVAGALTHGALHPQSVIPMIGASGAVAGLLGAFVVRLYAVQIRFWYGYFFLLSVRHGTFAAPAWVMIPLWFAAELFNAVFLDGTGVAYWAHVGGFCAGAAVALALRALRFEERVLGQTDLDAGEDNESFDVILPEQLGFKGYMQPPDSVPRYDAPKAAPELGPEPNQGIPLAAAPAATAPVEPSPVPPPEQDVHAPSVWETIQTGVPDFAELDRLAEQALANATAMPASARAAPEHPAPSPSTLGRALRGGSTPLILAIYDRVSAEGRETGLSPLEELHLAKILRDEGRFASAVSACRRATEADLFGPFATRGIYFAGRILIEKLDRKEDGVALLRQLIVRFPGDRFANAAVQLLHDLRV